MKDFLHRTITEETQVIDENGDPLKVKVWRTRNSNGHRSIGIEFGTQRIEFHLRDEYEQHARLVIDLLGKMCDEPCLLPEMTAQPNHKARTNERNE